MAFWWPLVVLGVAFAVCRFLFMLIPHNVPSIEVDASDVLEDGSQTKENSYIYIPRKGKMAQADKVQCYEPATMKYLGFCEALTPEEVKEHVAQAREAQKIWASSSFRQRRQFLRILLKYIIEHQELICEISSRDTGKTMVDASLGEIMTTCEKITWLLSEGEKWLKPEYRSSGRSMLHKRAKVEFHPLGVIGAIVSWNYPFHNVFNPMLAAVFSGNAAVIKVSEHASWSGCFYFRIIQAALAAVGAPDNLVHIITGYAETGQALVSSVDKIIFVGSPGVGKMIMQKASETLIPVTLELGGKDAFIVCEDVDLATVVQVAMRGALQSSGQNCAGAERFYVHKDIYTAFVAQIVKLVKSISVSLPFGGVKHSGFGRFAGVEGLRACCLVKSVVVDRWWPFIKTVIPKPIQYPVAENAFVFQESLVEALYGLNVWDRLRSLINVVKIISEQNPKSSNVKKSH
ncbi:aldehyde dehydrogenase 22A1 isoform X2 [Musa acuminata AAA Group]|uniref:aldehyde dehydrogenase 22A1 isoform X2 n=1 Tax=Musa acuminata AAA Group TaxID=214697 RepID=UPI0031DB692D